MEKKFAFSTVCSGPKCAIFVLYLTNSPEIFLSQSCGKTEEWKKTQVPE